jgi:hypothetical protein
MNLKNKIVPIHGKKYQVLAGKPTALPNRILYLLSAEGGGTDYSLWLAEPDDNDEEKVHMWPYKGPDAGKDELIKELLEDFLEHAFDK